MRNEKLPERAAVSGSRLMKGLEALKERRPLIGDVRGKGLMIGVELIRDKAKTPADAEAKKIRIFCREQGVLLGLGGSYANVLRLQPPLVITDAEIDRVLDVLARAFSEIKRTPTFQNGRRGLGSVRSSRWRCRRGRP